MRTIIGLFLAAWSLNAAAPSIRDVDFRNFAYQTVCRDEKTALRDGRYEIKEPLEERLSVVLVSILYTYLGGPGDADAVVVTACNGGGSGSFTEGHVFELADGKLRLIARLPAGDRANGAIIGVASGSGRLMVSRYAGDAACCPKSIETVEYKLKEGKLSETGFRILTPLSETQ
jgi:hypothetical protein